MSDNYRKVFLSYAREDKEAARKIKQKLDDWNFEVWLDEKRLYGGEEWVKSTKESISNCNFFVVLLSSKSVNKKKGFIQTEITEALNRLKKREENFSVIPVRIEECDPCQPEFKDINWIDLFPCWDEGCEKLIKALKKDLSCKRNLEIIGFDLGHGETAITKTSLYASTQESKFNLTEPKIVVINGKTSIITAVGMKDGKVLIGDDAYASKDMANLHVLFKSYHLESSEVREPIQNFVKSCLNLIQDQIKLDENTHFFVGSPSGWTENDRKRYEEVLKKAGMTNVVVKAESRAAFLEAKESGDLNEFSELEDSVLIIDIGSSTTDFTIVKNYEEKPLDFGHNNLGGGLLDIAILEYTLNSLPVETKNSFNDVFLEKPELKAQCLLKCREIKEKYFSKDNEDHWIENPVASDAKRLDKKKNLFFEVELYQDDMRKILDSPIHQLEDKSWGESFRDELKKCQNSTKYQTPKLVLLTGGASRMGFVKSICEEVLPSETTIRVGLDPSLTIARGLAYVGRIDFKVRNFIKEVEAFTASNSLRTRIESSFNQLSQELSKTTFSVFSKVIKRNLKKWKMDEITLINELEDYISKDIDTELNSEKCLKIFEEKMDYFLQNLSLEIQKDTREICARYGIPEATFKLEMAEKSVADDNNMLRYFRAEEMVENEVWTKGSAMVGAILGGMVASCFTVSNMWYWGFLEITTAGVTSWIILLAVGLFGGLYGLSKIEPLSEAATDIIKDSDIPKFLRLLNDKQIDQFIEKGRPKFEQNVIAQFKKQSETRFNSLIEAIKKDLLDCADKARILIK